MSSIRRLWLALCLTLLTVCAAGVTLAQSGAENTKGAAQPTPQATSPAPAGPLAGSNAAAVLPVEPALLKQALTDPRQPLDFVVYLQAGADLAKWETAPPLPKAASPDEARARLAARRADLVQALKTTAAGSQAGLLALLSARQAKGEAVRVKPFWVVNSMGVQADGTVLLELAARPEVAVIRANHPWTLDDAPARKQADDGPPTPQNPPWDIQRVRADYVWRLMGVTGQGVVVANMDTGVDWQHPDLQAAYRGYDPRGLPNHRGNWYVATDEVYLYPGDGNGHGTHTMGLMAGRQGTGVAPGARWIAVKAFTDTRRSTDVWLLDAFQWLVAPGDDPALAPDIVNGSWSSAARDSDMFRQAVRALRAAGIVPVFSAGNDGPVSQTVGIPGGYPEVLTVGATDDQDSLAVFSSRGPSAFGVVKPDVVAPGVAVLSTYHGGGYAIIDGTSMATPLVAGVAALLRQAAPDLSPDQVAQIIRSTARPIGAEPVPNNNVGAGLVDAYAALSALLGSGELTGRVTRSRDGGPVPGAEVRVTSVTTNASIRLTTDATGAYTVPLQAGQYEVTVSAFGYQPIPPRTVSVEEGGHVRADFELTLLPFGVALGRVTDTAGAPLPATIIVENTPLTTTAQAATGAYSVALPPGTYRLRVEHRGHRIGRAEITIAAPGAVTQQDFRLAPAPSILLVDSGGWYSANTTRFYQAALDARDYLHTVHLVRSAQSSGLTLEKLQDYDLVIWSSPADSPRLVGAERLLADYLRQGGRLIISGQDIAYWDGGGAGPVPDYYRAMLNARFIIDDGAFTEARGAGPLQGQTWQFNGADSADNQTSLDVIEQVKPEAGTVAALYPGGAKAGILVNTCVPYRSLYLAFGVEGVRGLAARAALLDQAIQTVAAPTPTRALTAYALSQEEVAPAGGLITYTVRLRNIGSQNDEYTLRVADAQWPTQVLDPGSGRPLETLALDKCATRDVLVSVRVPNGMGWHTRDTATVQVQSRNDSAVGQSVQLVSKTPAPVLLVDDHQFVNVQDVYTRALQLGGIPYDRWNVNATETPGRGSPSVDRLGLYPVVIWFTGYDFLDTLSAAEEARLTTYLNNGGRLLLSSQDYLFTAGLTRFATEYLGVLSHIEDLQTVQLVGLRDDPVGDGLGPFVLDFAGVLGSTRYNHSDALTPNAFAQPAFIGSHGRPVGLRRDAGRYRTVFFGLPLETLGPEHLAPTLRRIVGWLGPLGASRINVDRAIAADGDTLTFSLDIRTNSADRRERVRLVNPLPEGTQLVLGSLIGGTLENGQIVWEGPLGPGETHGVRYRVTTPTGLPPGAELVNRATLQDESALASEIFTRVRFNVPDLSPSVAIADRDRVFAGDVVNFTLSLRNRGTLDATTQVTVSLPSELSLVPGSAAASSGAVTVEGDQVRWAGAVAREGVPVVIAFQARVAEGYAGGPLTTRVSIADGYTAVLERAVVLGATRQLFLPLIEKRAQP